MSNSSTTTCERPALPEVEGKGAKRLFDKYQTYKGNPESISRGFFGLQLFKKYKQDGLLGRHHLVKVRNSPSLQQLRIIQSHIDDLAHAYHTFTAEPERFGFVISDFDEYMTFLLQQSMHSCGLLMEEIRLG